MNATLKAIALCTVGLAIAHACGDPITGIDLLGEWGGDHVSLQLTREGGQAEYDCAHGIIGEPVRPDRRGDFDVAGTHVFERGGPVIESDPPDEHPARYTGSTNGRSMTYRVRIEDTGQVLGPFEVRLGEPARLFKCL